MILTTLPYCTWSLGRQVIESTAGKTIVGVSVFVMVGVWVSVGVRVMVGVFVIVGVLVGVKVRVGVCVGGDVGKKG